MRSSMHAEHLFELAVQMHLVAAQSLQFVYVARFHLTDIQYHLW